MCVILYEEHGAREGMWGGESRGGWREGRVILQVLYLEITQGKIVAASLELLSKSCCALLLFLLLLLLFFFLVEHGGGGEGNKKKKETEPKK